MANQRIAELIAEGLQQGFTHPGDPERDIPPTPILLPFKPGPGMPKEMGELLTGTAKLLSECIVELIETKGGAELVDREEATQLRRAAGEAPDGPRFIPIHCRCDTKRQRPLAVLTAGPPDRFVVDGRTFLRGVSQHAIQCPHDATIESESLGLEQTVIETMNGMLKRDLSTKGRRIIDDAMAEFLRGDGWP